MLKHRLGLLVAYIGLTVFMGYQATKVRFSYELPQILPESNPDFQLYESFKARYGENSNVLVIGVATDQLFTFPIFRDWYELNHKIKKISGVKDIISSANLVEIVRNDSLKRFDFRQIIPNKPITQAEVDSIKAKISRLPFYQGFIISEDGKAHLMAIMLEQDALNHTLNTPIDQIKRETLAFENLHGLKVHLSGMPYIRSEYVAKVRHEIVLFSILAVIVTGLILLFFFRSWVVMLISLGAALVGAVWSVGFMGLLGHEITQLTSLLPSLMVVIGVSNTFFWTKKYHEEFGRLGNQRQALQSTTERIGETTFWTNLMATIGFGVFSLTGSKFLAEFGQIAALSLLCTYIIGLALLPILYSYSSALIEKQPRRLENKNISFFLKKIDGWVHHRAPVIYGSVAALLIVALVGLTQIKNTGFMADNLPQNSPLLNDLDFFKRYFKGVMAFEINIDTGRPGRVLMPQTLTKINLLQKEFAQCPEFTKPLSVVEATKFIYQGYRDGDSKYFVVPDALELSKLAEYAGNFKSNDNRLSSFMDSTRRYTRVSFQIKDVGTHRIAALCALLQPKIDSLFNIDTSTGKQVEKEERYEAKITGSSVVFSKGNDYLLQNLVESTLLVIVLIAILMVVAFGHWRLILIALVPSSLPLVMTAGIMGFGEIPLNAATTLVFSITFGLSSSSIVHFLTMYQDEFRNNKKSVSEAISTTIQFAGISMFYNAIILFAGFVIFTASSFRETVALGILVAITVLMGMLSNLILLPTFLLWMNKKLVNG
ncbi:efflux RND transporter permease subunit [Runella salmonicolor]|uniref:MMPL family transporter n=1 Tax=Runella salmonicolor TaxID=2950278 RepID=A0ABT1FW28_9BACT|nr:MMPL family transporter [Runella salmonicolor]MCP1385980.1 MMPL family transporter [Runella salmonicolor]